MLTMDEVERLIRRSRPRGGGWRGSRLMLLGVGLLLGAFLARPDFFGPGDVPAWVLPQVVLLVLVIMAVRSGIRRRQTGQLMLSVFEAVQLEQWDQARELLKDLLCHPISHSRARAEALLSLGAVAESEHNYAAAQRIYETLVDEQHVNPLQQHVARVALGAVWLRNGQIADAVDLIDLLVRSEMPDSLRAQVELLSLFREVFMGQAVDGIGQAEERRRLFREYMSTRAGYGYGLLAAAFDHADQPETARRYWRDATLLVKAPDLVNRFEELKPIAARYVAAEQVL